MIQPECETCGTHYRLKAVLGGWTSVPACSCPQPASAPTTCTDHTGAFKFVQGKAVKLLTYNDWKSAGFYVRKGERAMGYNSKGEALFDRKQVEEQDAFDRIHKLIWEENR